MTMQQAAQAAGGMINLTMMQLGDLSKAFYKTNGKKALPAIIQVMSLGGVEQGKAMQQMGIPKSFHGIADGYRMMTDLAGMEMAITELSDKSLQFKTSKCPYCVEGTSKELCEAMMSSDRQLMSTFLGKKVEVKVLKSVAVGDKECEVIFSLK